MAILSKGHTFAANDSVTSTKLNNLVDSAAFVSGSSGTTDDTSLEVNTSGRLQVKDSGVSSAKLAAGSVTTTKLPNATSSVDGVTYPKLQYATAKKVLGNMSGVTAAISEVDVLDEGDMSSNSSTALATQRSIKSYVDTKAAGTLVLGTSQAATSGTALSYTGVASTVKRITMLLSGVRTNGTSLLTFRLGTASGYVTTGYSGSSSIIVSGVATQVHSVGFSIYDTPPRSTLLKHGSIVFTLVDAATNTWAANGVFSHSTANNSFLVSGSITLPATLDRVQLTTVGGVNTFAAGIVNVVYE